MKNKAKYNIGDELWFRILIFNVKAKVIGITTINIKGGGVIMEYGLIRKRHYYRKRECDLFPTKEELLKSL